MVKLILTCLQIFQSSQPQEPVPFSTSVFWAVFHYPIQIESLGQFVQNFQELIGCSKYSWECPFVPHNTLTDEPIILFNKCYFLPAEEQNRKGTIFSFFISFILEKD